MESFGIAVNAVLPFCFYICFGYLTRRVGLVDQAFLRRLNQMVFRAFFPIMMFCNLYDIDPGNAFDGRLLATVVISTLAVTGVCTLVVPRFVKENARRGVVVQALFRSNTVLFMLPLLTNIYGDSVRAIATMVLAFAVPLYNVLAVVVLESFRGGKPDPKDLLKNVATNPMILGAAAGLLVFALGIRLPGFLSKPLQQYADLCTPLAMFIMGGTLKFSRMRRDALCLTVTVAIKLVGLPLAMFAVATAMGFGPQQRLLLVMLWATPAAASTYTMAESLGGDGDLAAELVAATTVTSVFTLFLWIFGLGQLGMI